MSDAPVSAQLFDRAQAVIPGGVNSPVRAFRAVGGTPRFMTSGRGPYITDVDGREYVDCIASWGPMILGHAHPAVVEAVATAATRGFSFGTPTLGEVELAEEIISRLRTAADAYGTTSPVEQVRLVNSGTEATMSAIRLARGVTGRRKVLKFAGCYHGHVDALLAAGGSGLVTLALPDTPGVTGAEISETIVAPYNDLVAVEQAFDEFGADIACVITEAAAGNMGAVPPLPGFNAGLRELTTRYGALLISDEVMTGFRVSPAGWYGLDPVAADITTFGKVMGGGLPAAAFGGPAEIMGRLAPNGPVYQAGTLSGNPIAVAAGLTTLRHCTPDVYARVDAAASTVAHLVGEALTDAGVEHVVQFAGNMFSVFFASGPVRNFGDAQAAQGPNLHRYKAFFHSMLDAGVYLPPSAYEAWFLSAAHDDAALDTIAAALPAAAAAAAGGHDVTTVHLLRHGEVFNPDKVLYGRLPDFHLSDRGREQAQAAADWIEQRVGDAVVHLRCSPLERARETSEPLQAATGLSPVIDDRLIEAANGLEGQRVGGPSDLARAAVKPRNFRLFVDPFRPSWGEPYRQIAERVYAAVLSARAAAAEQGGDAVCVSHQLPIYASRLFLEGRPLAHSPRHRQCALTSVTSLTFTGPAASPVVTGVAYYDPSEQAAH